MNHFWGFLGGASGKDPTCQCKQTEEMWDPLLGWEDSLEGGHGKPLQLSCLEDPTDREAWAATVHRVVQSRTQLKLLSMHAHSEQLPEL